MQLAGVEAINGNQDEPDYIKREFEKRMLFLVDKLNSLPGVICKQPKGAIYAFANIRDTGMSSKEFAKFSLEKAGVALTPGHFFGSYGEGFVRLCAVQSIDIIEEALESLKRALSGG